MDKTIPRLVIAATQSGAGKTTITAGLLAALRAKGLKVQSYKVGPDYIDPGFHELASGRPAHNLDSWLVGTDRLTDIFSRTAAEADLAVIEGVMGLYDGGRSGVSSTAEIAKKLQAPVILVIDAKSMGESAAAIALGFKEYDKDVRLAGVILNRLGSDSHRVLITEALQKLAIPVYGAIKRNTSLGLPERHLGLTPTTENDAAATIELIGTAIAAQTEIDALIELAHTAPPLPSSDIQPAADGQTVRIAYAKDEAFSFYYPESLAVLAGLGAELIPFSPLTDQELPANIDGLLLGGGFPEMFAAKLSANQTMRQSICRAAAAKLPIYAECGGFMYLTRAIRDFDGRAYEMVGLIPAECSMQQRLQTVGYVEATAIQDNIILTEGETLRGHEFHFSVMNTAADDFPWAFSFEKKRTGAVYPAGYAAGNILASYLHIHFAGSNAAAERFVETCRRYRGEYNG